jgi:type I restriction enzyme M protein
MDTRSEGRSGEHINSALRLIELENDALYDIFRSIDFRSAKLGSAEQADILLNRLIEAFAAPALTFNVEQGGGSDAAVSACEALLTFADEARGKRGAEFTTPLELSQLIARLMQPVAGETLYDPCNGLGGTLLECAKEARLSSAGKGARLFGQEANGSTWALSRMSMILHGESDCRLEFGDSLRNPKLLEPSGQLMTFDVVVSNPPFSLREWGYEEATRDPFARYWRGVPPRGSADFAFISHMISSLKSNGRMAVVVSLGVLFRTGVESRIRKQLIEEKLIDAVIALPPKMFGHPAIPTAILLLRRGRTTDDVLFIDASRTYEAGRIRNLLGHDALSRIEAVYQARSDMPQFAKLVSSAEIAEHGYNLSVVRYVELIDKEEKVDLEQLRAERLQLQDELEHLETKLAGLLMQIGYEYQDLHEP